MPLLELRDLTVELPTPSDWVAPVNSVSLALEPGESIGLVGESGSGKTMLSLALMGLLPQGARVRGEALLAGTNSNAINLATLSAEDDERWRAVRGRRIAMIFQEPMTALNPVMRVGAQLSEAIRAHEPALRGAALNRRVLEALALAAIPEPERRIHQFPHELSGGLRQRVLIAMAIAAGPVSSSRNASSSSPLADRILIADEPTTALDVTVQKQILELLSKLRRELGLALIFITHDLGVVAQIADRLLVLYAGRIVESGPVHAVLRNPRHPYTQGLLRASLRLDRRPVVPIAGAVPSLDSLPPGCAFSPRCPKHIAECDAAVPTLRPAGEHHDARCILV
ncbi:MAG TPA: ABC transporter ATP-binding protein [Candidatus Acidoferrales bacterium]|nr:ABC transporter ATP-binding protein [Candidatus Acidoferrales bacterium]